MFEMLEQFISYFIDFANMIEWVTQFIIGWVMNLFGLLTGGVPLITAMAGLVLPPALLSSFLICLTLVVVFRVLGFFGSNA